MIEWNFVKCVRVRAFLNTRNFNLQKKINNNRRQHVVLVIALISRIYKRIKMHVDKFQFDGFNRVYRRAHAARILLRLPLQLFLDAREKKRNFVGRNFTPRRVGIRKNECQL